MLISSKNNHNTFIPNLKDSFVRINEQDEIVKKIALIIIKLLLVPVRLIQDGYYHLVSKEVKTQNKYPSSFFSKLNSVGEFIKKNNSTIIKVALVGLTISTLIVFSHYNSPNLCDDVFKKENDLINQDANKNVYEYVKKAQDVVRDAVDTNTHNLFENPEPSVEFNPNHITSTYQYDANFIPYNAYNYGSIYEDEEEEKNWLKDLSDLLNAISLQEPSIEDQQDEAIEAALSVLVQIAKACYFVFKNREFIILALRKDLSNLGIKLNFERIISCSSQSIRNSYS